MSEENVETVRSIFDMTARGDFSRWFDEVADDFVFVTSPDIPDAGTYRGEAARDWITAWVESYEGHAMEPATSSTPATRSSSHSSNGVVRVEARSRCRAAGG
jgi:ketosteroid isomerase-like protein